MIRDFVIEAWTAYNKGDNPEDVHEMSFEMDYKTAKKRWKGQEIRPCQIHVGK
jgi:hypothetical protein